MSLPQSSAGRILVVDLTIDHLQIALEHSTVHPGGEIYAKVIETLAGTRA